MGVIKWWALKGLQENDQVRGREIYAAIEAVESGKDPAAFENLFTGDPDGYRRVTKQLERRDLFLGARIDDDDGMREWFCADG